jgi:tetratricopeptide (TPR) repeat protein
MPVPFAPPRPEATSLLGLPLYARDALAGADVLKLERRLAEVEQATRSTPADSAALLEHAACLASLSRYREAIDLYGRGIDLWPDDSRLHEQRGRRHINLREFRQARSDLEQAAQLGPTADTLLYLGIVNYLERKYDQALREFKRSLRKLGSADGSAHDSIKRLRRLDWVFMTLLRLGRHEEAQRALARTDSMMALDEVIASFLYCFRFYRGQQQESVTRELVGQLSRWGNSRMYGLGNWHQCRGSAQEANAYYAAALNTTNWPSFTFIAAELELAGDV